MEDTASKKPLPAGWELYPHDADVGVRGFGATLETALEEAAYAMTAVVTNPESVYPKQRVEITLEGDEPEQLLFDWLNALVFEMATRGMLFSRFEIFLGAHRLRATAWGEAVDVARHEPAAEVKGATYTDLKVYREPDGRWTAQCVVDV